MTEGAARQLRRTRRVLACLNDVALTLLVAYRRTRRFQVQHAH